MSSGDESGYERWRAEVDGVVKAAHESGATELPVAADAAGYERWRAEMATERFEFMRRWGVPLGQRARVMLLGLDEPLVGLLREVENACASKKRGIWLVIGDRKFHSGQIESVVKIGNDE